MKMSKKNAPARNVNERDLKNSWLREGRASALLPKSLLFANGVHILTPMESPFNVY